ncbi:MAG: alpha/beta fold hydrolase [Minisyncoccia bacterium]
MKIILIILTSILVISLWGFFISIRPPKIVSVITPSEIGLTYEDVTFKTKDGLTLSGWFIPSKETKNGAKTIVLLHGYPADKGDILPSLAFLNDKYNLFLFDFRYFGQSEGLYSTAGAKETDDLVAAIKYLRSRGNTEIGVFGFSMGGAVALMVASQMPEIKAVISEASYARLDLMARELYRLPVINYPLAWLTELWAKLFIGININKVAPIDAVKNIQVPILIIHSKDDEVIPFKNAIMLQEVLRGNSRAEFWFQEKLIHGQFEETYKKRINDFFINNL